MTTLRNSVGERIREIRKAKGWTQQQLAEHSGLDDAYIGSVERGERNFSIDTLEKIVTALKVSTSDVFIAIDEDEEISLRRNAIDEYSVVISELKKSQIEIMKKIINELKNAF
ncbi:helix-turn-helix transcriptional regulator [Paenibacillus sp. UMB7766-LJ446]|uniref:helix-turn-helix domain-containing protein n=1 Tax=Paenibacillus sp. UMB7766-LJ446 TaxID=3046313 RepID=UPI00254DC4BF|nr:helix-turn-helix transcriptional regulator [Paenibacillus sp. UMB7766-LJ446]MDK8190550.1 helix-turn-helix transcriptional regulator [Paenibacillus sp. UMB7766-LJ446]